MRFFKYSTILSSNKKYRSHMLLLDIWSDTNLAEVRA